MGWGRNEYPWEKVELGVNSFFHLGTQTTGFLRGVVREMGKAEDPETLALYLYVFKYDTVSETQFKS